MNIAKILTPSVSITLLHCDDSVRQGLELMRRHSFTAIPVLDKNNAYAGSISEGDFLRHILKTGSTDLKDHEKYRIEEILRKDFCPPLRINATERELIDASMAQNFVPIVDDRGCLCGIITRRSLIAYLGQQ